MRLPLALALALAFAVPATALAADHGGPAKLEKVDSALLQLRQEAKRTARGVGVDVYVRGDVEATARSLRREGMRVLATTEDPFSIVEGVVPIAAIDDVAGLYGVRAVTRAYRGGVDAGGTLSQGDAVHRGPQARALGPSGAGVTMGVISDSMNDVLDGQGLANSQASGDLPADVRVLKDDSGSDEGRAMAEIIYDGAPGISTFLFASGTNSGAVGKADSINQLVANGARVIADDIFYLNEPFFQDGPVSQAVDAARAAGVAYFASAGNRARTSYESSYRDAAGSHDFDPGAGVDTRQSIVSIPGPGGFIQVALQWDEAWGGAQTDIDIDLVNATNGLPLLGVSGGQDNNIATGLPREVVTWTNPGPATPVAAVITRFAGTRSPFMKYIVQANIAPFTIGEFDTSSDTINPDAASAQGSLATAAIAYSESGLNDPEPFSSRGLKVRLFDAAGNRLAAPQVLQKPNIAAADGVATSVPGFDCVPASECFFGTSAATPSAAGVGALILSAKPTNNVDDVYAILQEPINSIDCTLAGRPDLDCGMGFVLADNAVTRALDPTPPAVTASVNPATPNGKNGFYVKQDVTVSFVASDDGSPITSQTGCAPVTITADTPATGTTLTCSARSAGGTTSSPVTIKRDDRSPSLSALRTRKKGTRVSFNLSEAATVTITIERRRRGRFRRVRRFTVNGKTGKNSARRGRPKKAKAGRYRVKMRATDPAGNRSSVKRKKFRVR